MTFCRMKLTTFALFLSFATYASTFHFEVKFTQKDTASYSTASPSSFLSSTCLSRRLKFSIPVDISDYPVTREYLDSLQKHGVVKSVSKWLNSAILATADSAGIDSLKSLPFVSSLKFIGKSSLALVRTSSTLKNQKITLDHGLAAQGIEQMNGDFLHDNGYMGEGLTIAVLDGGFASTNSLSIFTHLYDSSRIIATRNFVSPVNDIYNSDVHGTEVLSV